LGSAPSTWIVVAARVHIRRHLLQRLPQFGEAWFVSDMALESFPVAGVLRRARRTADLSQRELAKKAKLQHGVVARIESGRSQPSVALLNKLLQAAGVMLVPVVIDTGDELAPMPAHTMRDAADRYFPSHLDVRRTSGPGSLMWWNWWYIPGRRPEKPLASFRRNRKRRDSDRIHQQQTSVWYDERGLLALMYPGRRSREPADPFEDLWR
jgi:transcriptional regulator with XRE-family HTH domain